MTPQGSQPVLGAISTCVGTSVDAGQAAPGVKVRPHVRGNVMIALRVTARYGSPPPLAWGRRLPVWEPDDLSGSTPKRVGTSPPRHHQPRVVEVHPHVRGDVGVVSTPSDRQNGPPPRAWGRQRPDTFEG